jgi:hypothetical protein
MCARLHNKRNWPKGLDLKTDEKEAESFEPCWLQHGPSRKEIFFEPLALRRDSPLQWILKEIIITGYWLMQRCVTHHSYFFLFKREGTSVCVYTLSRISISLPRRFSLHIWKKARLNSIFLKFPRSRATIGISGRYDPPHRQSSSFKNFIFFSWVTVYNWGWSWGRRVNPSSLL